MGKAVSGWIKFRALLATARIANVPSVVSNVFTGFVLGLFWSSGAFLWASIAGMCLYVAGNFLNDWHDRDWDRRHRPERALPAGLFCRSSYLAIGVGLLAMAWVAAWALGEAAMWVCGLITVLIFVYTWSHKRTGFGVVWVAACRGLLMVLGMVWVGGGLGARVLFPLGWSNVLFSTLPLFSYVVVLSLVARAEARGGVQGPTLLGLTGLLGLPVLFTVWLWKPIFSVTWVLPAAIPYLLWMVFCHLQRGNPARHVPALLAGIPLVDGMVLLPIVFLALVRVTEFQPLMIVVWPLAFVFGLLLQKVAPAS